MCCNYQNDSSSCESKSHWRVYSSSNPFDSFINTYLRFSGNCLWFYDWSWTSFVLDYASRINSYFLAVQKSSSWSINWAKSTVQYIKFICCKKDRIQRASRSHSIAWFSVSRRSDNSSVGYRVRGNWWIKSQPFQKRS